MGGNGLLVDEDDRLYYQQKREEDALWEELGRRAFEWLILAEDGWLEHVRIGLDEGPEDLDVRWV